jgi:hypothetical protein
MMIGEGSVNSLHPIKLFLEGAPWTIRFQNGRDWIPRGPVSITSLFYLKTALPDSNSYLKLEICFVFSASLPHFDDNPHSRDFPFGTLVRKSRETKVVPQIAV